MVRSKLRGADYIAHTRPQERRRFVEDKKHEHTYDKETAEICLNCTLPKCRGGKGCAFYKNGKRK